VIQGVVTVDVQFDLLKVGAGWADCSSHCGWIGEGQGDIFVQEENERKCQSREEQMTGTDHQVDHLENKLAKQKAKQKNKSSESCRPFINYKRLL